MCYNAAYRTDAISATFVLDFWSW